MTPELAAALFAGIMIGASIMAAICGARREVSDAPKRDTLRTPRSAVLDRYEARVRDGESLTPDECLDLIVATRRAKTQTAQWMMRALIAEKKAAA